MSNTKTFQGELTLTRIFAAPRDLVFRAWTESNMLAQWWGPRGFTNPVCEVDPRAGGSILIHMTAPDGSCKPLTGQFISVSMDEIIFTMDAKESDGTILLECRTTVTLEDSGPNTHLTMNTVVVGRHPSSEQMIGGMEEGWGQSIDRLGELLEVAK